MTYSHSQELKLHKIPELTENSTVRHFFIWIHYLYYSQEAINEYGVTHG